ncbi:MAG TPA: hypothetical protein VGC08_14830, partial [Pedobacter sp.]
DHKGWYKLGTNERGAFHAYSATLVAADSTLQAEEPGMVNPIKIDMKQGKILVGKLPYIKVKK